MEEEKNYMSVAADAAKEKLPKRCGLFLIVCEFGNKEALVKTITDVAEKDRIPLLEGVLNQLKTKK